MIFIMMNWNSSTRSICVSLHLISLPSNSMIKQTNRLSELPTSMMSTNSYNNNGLSKSKSIILKLMEILHCYSASSLSVQSIKESLFHLQKGNYSKLLNLICWHKELKRRRLRNKTLFMSRIKTLFQMRVNTKLRKSNLVISIVRMYCKENRVKVSKV